jgi:hypothetical protein
VRAHSTPQVTKLFKKGGVKCEASADTVCFANATTLALRCGAPPASGARGGARGGGAVRGRAGRGPGGGERGAGGGRPRGRVSAGGRHVRSSAGFQAYVKTHVHAGPPNLLPRPQAALAALAAAATALLAA